MSGKPPSVRDRMLWFIRSEKAGITTVELAARLGRSTEQITSPLSKLAAYGILVKEHHRSTGRRNGHEFCTWRMPEKAIEP